MTDQQPLPDPPAEMPPCDDGPLSRERLSNAFAQMLGNASADQGADQPPAVHIAPDQIAGEPSDAESPTHEPSPRSIIEAMLFVGRPDNRPLSARELAATAGSVSPKEVNALVAELNAIYVSDAAPYEIVGSQHGYQMELRNDLGRMRDKFYGRVREAKLSPAAVEVLSVVAYSQPVSADEVAQLRGTPSGALLSTLVRRKLLRLERPQQDGQKPQYLTTERFLRLLQLDSIASLPRSEELEKA